MLFLPASAEQVIQNSLITSTLSDIQFIEAVTGNTTEYLAGQRFLNLLTFLGCSPDINLVPDNNSGNNSDSDSNHCLIRILEISTTPRCIGFTQNASPRCPHCKKRIANRPSGTWQQASNICICDKCRAQTPYAHLNWRHECGFGCCGFEITHIYPHEAVPTDQLLDALESATGTPWQYSYAQTNGQTNGQTNSRD